MTSKTLPSSANEWCPHEGTILGGRYRVGPVLGSGGMAVVVAAWHIGLDQRVAIKLLLPEVANDPDVVERFEREGRAAIQIRSEHVVRVLDVGHAFGRPYLVLEYLDGEDLEKLVRTKGPLPIAEAVDLILQACEAIGEAHALGIIHRDLKAANLFLTHRADGSPAVKVIDFGISKFRRPPRSGRDVRSTAAKTVMGSPQFMAPESMESAAAADERSDIWSLGVILYQLLAGVLPFDAASLTELYAQVLGATPASLATWREGVPAALEQAVFRCLEKDRRLRFQSVAELAHALSAFGTAATRISAGRVARVLGDTRDYARPWLAATMRPVAMEPLQRGARRSRRPSSGHLLTMGLVVAGVAAVTAAVQSVGPSLLEAPGSPVVASAGPAASMTLTSARTASSLRDGGVSPLDAGKAASRRQ